MSIISVPRSRLPDQLTVNFGPTEAIANAVLALDYAVRETGIRLSLNYDFEELGHVNRHHRASWYPLTPNFDPRHCALHPDNAFWLKGVDASGEVALTEAVKLYSVPNDGSFKSEIETLRYYYDEPQSSIAAGVTGQVTSPMAADMRGRITYGGAVWVRPDFRGARLAGMVAPLSHLIALTRWYPDYHTCFLSRKLAERGMAKVYGFREMEYGVKIANLPGFDPPMFEPVLDFAFCWMNNDEMVTEAEHLGALQRSHALPSQDVVEPVRARA